MSESDKICSSLVLQVDLLKGLAEVIIHRQPSLLSV